jgi:hypothetical protein
MKVVQNHYSSSPKKESTTGRSDRESCSTNFKATFARLKGCGGNQAKTPGLPEALSVFNPAGFLNHFLLLFCRHDFRFSHLAIPRQQTIQIEVIKKPSIRRDS